MKKKNNSNFFNKKVICFNLAKVSHEGRQFQIVSAVNALPELDWVNDPYFPCLTECKRGTSTKVMR